MIVFKAPKDRIVHSVTREVTEKVTDQLTDTELQILELIEEDPAYTSSVLAEKLSLSRKTIALWLKKLKEKNIIERIGSDRKGYWKIK